MPDETTFHTVALYHGDFITHPYAWHLLNTVFTLVLPPACNLSDKKMMLPELGKWGQKMSRM
jgi:hypothetical protein